EARKAPTRTLAPSCETTTIVRVRVGVKNWCTRARIERSNCRVSPSLTSVAIQESSSKESNATMRLSNATPVIKPVGFSTCSTSGTGELMVRMSGAHTCCPTRCVLRNQRIEFAKEDRVVLTRILSESLAKERQIEKKRFDLLFG